MVKAAVAGATAVWVMDRFDWFVFEHENQKARLRTESVRPLGEDPAHVLAIKAASLFGKGLGPAPAHQHPAGLAVHYLVPMAFAVLYDRVKRRLPAITSGKGALFGAGLFLVLDEILNPLLGLAAKPHRYPWQRHVRELTAHVIYGCVTHAFLEWLVNSTAAGVADSYKKSADGKHTGTRNFN